MPSCSFSEALEIRYGEDVVNNPSEPREIFVVGSFPGRSSPGGKLLLPKTLTLNCCEIDRAGSLRSIEELCHNVEELDLAQNEISDLNEVDDLIRLMPNLNFLNLSHNNMKAAQPEVMTKSCTLRSLVLNHTHVSWDVIVCFLDAMPNIQELHISLNDYTSVEIDDSKEYPNLKQLFICSNPLSSWEEVLQIDRAFPCLETLIMADSNIDHISEPSLWKGAFKNLMSLNLNNAPLKGWTDVERLNCFPKLDDIRLQGISVLDDLDKVEKRQHVIAYLPSISRLNGSVITQKEREDAERSFIRHYLSRNNKPKRVYELEEIHGKLDPLVEVDLSPKKTARVDVHFDEEQLTLSINLQQSVQELKTMLSNKFGVRPTKMRLFYVDQDQKEYTGPDEMRYNARKLHSYQIRDGDEFLLYTK